MGSLFFAACASKVLAGGGIKRGGEEITVRALFNWLGFLLCTFFL